MRIKPLLIWLAIEISGSPGRYPENPVNYPRPKILDLIENGKRQHDDDGGCSPPVISQGIKLIDEVNKDCEYFGKFFFNFKHIYLFDNQVS